MVRGNASAEPHPQLVCVDVHLPAKGLSGTKIGALLADAIRAHDEERVRVSLALLPHHLDNVCDSVLLQPCNFCSHASHEQ